MIAGAGPIAALSMVGNNPFEAHLARLPEQGWADLGSLMLVR